jgi:hypothetical protein
MSGVRKRYVHDKELNETREKVSTHNVEFGLSKLCVYVCCKATDVRRQTHFSVSGVGDVSGNSNPVC